VEHDKVPRNFFNAGKLFNKRSTTGAEGTSKK
jgi:hypothetical protein